MSTQEFSVTGMSCEHCEASVREEVSEVPGVTGVDVSATTGVLTITADGKVDESAVIAAVEEAGYTVTAR
ncbi:heavy-metal-associated domain-containing protein [Corynebacterium sp. 320]|uniref:heavy-metal-associated domain-containing protein n=1 Tax=Corynebacterium TaxID=1716 RepID=UPI00125CBE8A|nr:MULTISPECIES: heavy metal-associated domain-containing protein [Corynebacterium]KAB1501320.1 heavy-metal-associated domain-containing protein [Corynebacterium sp. 320]KAB1551489.1 heavy-metal-associated domain-containing protein [Corynebacterium sp. 321]KAB1551683.1 heavy-metal-associated domain-containing protein [Corynebacterium sp. 319]KAB3525685.1 heavy-metal-associated domain-containing protein [Corynebacterium sp. 250]KAB3538673.1 heavy-metal-associated domain-containing protein [Cory